MKKTNKILAFALALLLALSMLPITAFASDAAAASTDSAKSIAISTADQFLDMECGKSYYLVDDIDLSTATVAKASDYYYIEKFNGVLDGRGHTITGVELTVTVAGSDELRVGLFGQLGGDDNNNKTGTIINNLKIENAVLNVKDKDEHTEGDTSTTYTGKINMGVLAAVTSRNDIVNIENVHIINADVDFESDGEAAGDVLIGGLIGIVYNFNADSCSFSGDIKSDKPSKPSTYVGGLFGRANNTGSGDGYTEYFRSVIDNCVNYGNVTVNNGVRGNWFGVGGIMGITVRNVYITDCVNTGKIVSDQMIATGGILGKAHLDLNGTTGEAQPYLVVITDCENSNTNTSNDIIGTDLGYCDSGDDRLFIYNCTGSDGNAAVLPEKYSTFFKIIEITTAEDFANIGVDSNYPKDGLYVLANDIDFATEDGDAKKTNYVINDFSGVLYGNNKTILGIDFDNTNASSKDIGFIYKLANTADAVVMKLNFGTEERPIDYVKTTGQGGILTSMTNSNVYQAFISDVDIYANVTETAGGGAFGMFGGKVWSNITVCDSNAYGTIKHSNHSGWSNVAGFFGQIEKPSNNYQGKPLTFINCNNFVDISISGLTNTDTNIGGFAGLFKSYTIQLIGCDNFGDIVNSDSTENAGVGALVAESRLNDANHIIHGCNNYGELSNNGATTGVGIAIGYVNNRLRMLTITDVGDYSSLAHSAIGGIGDGVTITTQTIIDFVDSNIADYVSENGISVTTRDAAAIRINADETKAGLRFKADVSANAAEGLKKAFGSDAVVSYGIIITPTAFKTAAGEFTAAALDKWAEGINGFGEDKAYIDIQVADGNWYEGKTGTIAASVNGLHGAEGSEEVNLFDESFSARAYIKVTVENEVVYTLYGNANDGEVFTDILGKALGDVLYTDDNGETWYTDEACENEADSTKYDFATYTLELSEEGAAVKKYSCYTEKQYEDLTTLQNTISAINS